MSFSEQNAIAMLKTGASFKEAAETCGLEINAVIKLWEEQKRWRETRAA